jgi:hypothetical protein
MLWPMWIGDWLYGVEGQRGRSIDIETALELAEVARAELKVHRRFTFDFCVPDGNGGWRIVPDKELVKQSTANLRRVHLRGTNTRDPSLMQPTFPPDQDPQIGELDIDFATGVIHTRSGMEVTAALMKAGNAISAVLLDAPPRLSRITIGWGIRRALATSWPWALYLLVVATWAWVVLTAGLALSLVVFGSIAVALLALLPAHVNRRVKARGPATTSGGHRLERFGRADRDLRKQRQRGFFLGIASGVLIVVAGGIILAAFGIGIPLAP